MNELIKRFKKVVIKSKITQNNDSKEIKKRKVRNQTAKSNKWLTTVIFGIGTGIFLCRKQWIGPGFMASQTFHLYDNRRK